MNGDLNRVLVDSRKEVHRAKGVLAKLYRRILWDLDIKPATMEKKILQYLDDPRNAIPKSGKARSTERGNIVKDLSKSEMTWNNFIKGIRILRPLRARLIVEFDWPMQSMSRHTFTLINENGEPGDNDPTIKHPFKESGMPE